MTKIENMREDSGLGRLLSECFAGGERLRRELRLSAEQAEELAAAYPADVLPMWIADMDFPCPAGLVEAHGRELV